MNNEQTVLIEDVLPQIVEDISIAFKEGFNELGGHIVGGLRELGNGDSTSSMGAIEAFGKHVGEKMDTMSDALNNVAEAIRYHADTVAMQPALG